MWVWGAILVGAVGCYLMRLAGMSVPRHLLDDPRVRKIAALLPIALLTALVTTQGFTGSHGLTLDAARTAGIGTAFVAIALRAPFLLIVVISAATAALLRLAF